MSSREYAMSRVQDALENAGNNHMKAQRLLMSWLEKDQTLLLGLVGPHLQSIVTHAIQHATMPNKKQAAPKKIDIKKEKPGEFGLAILEGLKGSKSISGTAFGETPPRGAVSKPGQASKAHISAIQKLADAGKNKNKDGKKK